MIKNISIQVIAFFLLFQLISWIRELPLLDINSEAPELALQTVDGKEFVFEAVKGKPTLLFFWAPWCAVCKASMPNLQDFHDNNKNDINVISIALSYESNLEVRKILAHKNMTVPTLLGNNTIAEEYKIKGFPTYYVLDKDGKVHSKSMGYSSELGMVARTLTL